MLPELKQQVPLMKELLKAMNIRIVEKRALRQMTFLELSQRIHRRKA